MQNDEIRKTPALVIALAWAFVGIPLLAGIFQTMLNAAKLFQ
jgi:hypothetical protein